MKNLTLVIMMALLCLNYKVVGQFATIQESFSIQAIDPSLSLELNWPLDRQVVQRNSSNTAIVNIAGQVDYNPSATVIFEYAIDNLNLQTGIVTSNHTNWTSFSPNMNVGNSQSKLFNINRTLPKGWYLLKVRGRSSSGVVYAQKEVKFGVGDIYFIAGQSNASGFTRLYNDELMYFEATNNRLNNPQPLINDFQVFKGSIINKITTNDRSEEERTVFGLPLYVVQANSKKVDGTDAFDLLN